MCGRIVSRKLERLVHQSRCIHSTSTQGACCRLPCCYAPQVAYPFMHLAFQMGDFSSLVKGRTVGAELLGASPLGEHRGCGGVHTCACVLCRCE